MREHTVASLGPDLLDRMVAAWWLTLPPAALQGTMVLLAVLVVDLLLPRRTWPQLRLALWALGLVELLLPPSWASPLAGRWFPDPWSSSLSERILSRPDLGTWTLAASVGWVSGVLIFAAVAVVRYRLVVGHWRARSRVEHGGAAGDGALLERCARRIGVSIPRVRWTDAGPREPQAFVTGLLRPTVFVARGLGPKELEHVLLHELAHIRRRDLLFAALEGVVQALFWFHPLVWWARQRTAALREQSCDLEVARSLGPAETPSYRRTLLELAGRRHGLRRSPTPVPGGLGFVHPRSTILLRLAMLESFHGERAWLRRLVTALAMTSLMLVAAPVVGSASRTAEEIAEVLRRPPGSLQLRYLVLRELAREQRRGSESP